MGCLKCGKETEENQVFCEECCQGMEKYPVKPGTVVQLQIRTPKAQEKKGQKRKEQDPKETIRQLRKLIRWLTVVIACMTVVICLLAGFVIHTMEEPATAGNIGRNYTTDTTMQPGN